MKKKEVTTNDIMDFLREHMLTREEAFETFATKTEVRSFRDEVATTLDGMTQMLKKFELELAALHHKFWRHEERLQKIGA